MRAVVGAGMPHQLAVALWLALAQSCATLAIGPHVSFSGRRCRVRAPLLQEASPPALDEPADEPLGSLPPVGNLLTSLDPQLISVVEQDPSTLTLPPTLHAGDKFVELFRSCAPYIKMHQGRTIVLHISSAVLNMPLLFDEAMEVRLGSFSLRVGGGRAEHRLSVSRPPIPAPPPRTTRPHHHPPPPTPFTPPRYPPPPTPSPFRQIASIWRLLIGGIYLSHHPSTPAPP